MGCGDLLHNVKFQIVVFSLGTIAGLAAFFVFWLVLHYVYASVLGGISAIYAFTLLLEIWRQHNIKDGVHIIPLTEMKATLMVKFIIAIAGMAVGSALVFYLVATGVVLHERFDSPYFMGAIQAWMTFKWSMAWTLHLYRYHNIGNAKLLEDEPAEV